MVSSWYKCYYENPKLIYKVTKEQVKNYQYIAIKRGSSWAKKI